MMASVKIVKTTIQVPKISSTESFRSSASQYPDKLAFLLDNVFTKEECEEWIRVTEEKGYEPALLNIGGGRQILATDVRNNTRCIWDSPAQADRLWQRIKEYIPDKWKGRKVMGLNERLRFLRYDPGEYFAPHMDGTYARPNGERSCITIQLYLNEGFKGGSTTFLYPGRQTHAFIHTDSEPNSKDIEVIPKIGRVLVFQHDILHEGSILEEGRKYSMRTDVMYDKTVS